MKVVTPREAVGLLEDGDAVWIGGSGAGHAVPQAFIEALAATYSELGSPRGLTTVRVVGIGDFADVGMSQLALAGLHARTITSNIASRPSGSSDGWSPSSIPQPCRTRPPSARAPATNQMCDVFMCHVYLSPGRPVKCTCQPC